MRSWFLPVPTWQGRRQLRHLADPALHRRSTLDGGGSLGNAQAMAAHENPSSTATTRSRDEVERIKI
jgi:hypothetical protein